MTRPAHRMTLLLMPWHSSRTSHLFQVSLLCGGPTKLPRDLQLEAAVRMENSKQFPIFNNNSTKNILKITGITFGVVAFLFFLRRSIFFTVVYEVGCPSCSNVFSRSTNPRANRHAPHCDPLTTGCGRRGLPLLQGFLI